MEIEYEIQLKKKKNLFRTIFRNIAKYDEYIENRG